MTPRPGPTPAPAPGGPPSGPGGGSSPTGPKETARLREALASALVLLLAAAPALPLIT